MSEKERQLMASIQLNNLCKCLDADLTSTLVVHSNGTVLRKLTLTFPENERHHD